MYVKTSFSRRIYHSWNSLRIHHLTIPYHRSRTDYISYDTLLDLTRSVHFPRLPPVKCVMACFFCARSSRMPFPITGQNYYSNLSCSSGFVLRTVKPVTDYEHKYIVVPLKHVLSVLDPGGNMKGWLIGLANFSWLYIVTFVQLAKYLVLHATLPLRTNPYQTQTLQKNTIYSVIKLWSTLLKFSSGEHWK